MNANLVPYGAGALLLGVIGLVVHDFALQWQPVPAALPLHVPLAYASALLLLGGGMLLMTRMWRRGALLLGSFYALWVAALHGPKLVLQPADLGTWLGVAEITGLASAGLLAWSTFDPAHRHVPARVGQVIFGACLLIYGASHFVYADFSATMIPGWLPMPLFWVYLTGCGHLAAGLSLLSGVATRLATTLLAAMFACFVLLLHVPRVIASPSSRLEWTMLAVSLSLFGAAWILRTGAMQPVGKPSSTRIPDGDAVRTTP